VAMFLSFW